MTIIQDPVETKCSVERCDGGGGPLGHPVVYLNLGKEGKVICPYCSKCFVKFKPIQQQGKRPSVRL
ncbi:MAG: zinc-finger domain-containing protein [Alphaproteobacteria bacterium]|nr:zinc-finger domain-containing protein [Alphaproteobacteria bacterium]